MDDQTVISPIESIDPLVGEQTPSLLMISGPQIGRSFPLSQAEFMLGRSPKCDMPIEDDLVSRYHCKLITSSEGIELIDLGSTNGTLLNGRRVERSMLKEGDQVQVGSTVILKFHLQEEVEAKFLSTLYDAATRDFLTSAYNKKFFIERIQEEFSHAQRHDRELSVLVLDLDHFKQVNDTHGHLAGDLALKKVAHHLMSNTRKDDIVSRFGGEEFVVLMRDVGQRKARELAEQMRKGIEAIPIKIANTEFKVTVSVGVASVGGGSIVEFKNFDQLIDHADKKLYEAKSTGRNKVCA